MDAVDIFAEAAVPVGVITRVFGNEFAPYLNLAVLASLKSTE